MIPVLLLLPLFACLKGGWLQKVGLQVRAEGDLRVGTAGGTVGQTEAGGPVKVAGDPQKGGQSCDVDADDGGRMATTLTSACEGVGNGREGVMARVAHAR